MGKSDRRDNAGRAEQFYANAKAKEAAEAAVVACSAEGVPQDAECFICKSSVEGKGIVRGCACRGTMGLAHLSCLVRQAQVAAEPAIGSGTFRKWHMCFDCGQWFHGPVLLALGRSPACRYHVVAGADALRTGGIAGRRT